MTIKALETGTAVLDLVSEDGAVIGRIADTHAAEIVRAVNCHDELARLLERCLEYMVLTSGRHGVLKDEMRAILVAAGRTPIKEVQ